MVSHEASSPPCTTTRQRVLSQDPEKGTILEHKTSDVSQMKKKQSNHFGVWYTLFVVVASASVIFMLVTQKNTIGVVSSCIYNGLTGAQRGFDEHVLMQNGASSGSVQPGVERIGDAVSALSLVSAVRCGTTAGHICKSNQQTGAEFKCVKPSGFSSKCLCKENRENRSCTTVARPGGHPWSS